jgi:mannose-1-phosphate guanylyltransferase
MSRYIAIMAGGIGSRFWPASTEDRPKQFLDILGIGKSLIRMTYERAVRLVKPEHILILTNARYKALVMEHLPELPERNILCEPVMRNTAPCIAYTALHIFKHDPGGVFAVLPSDQVILKEDEFVRLVEQAMEAAMSRDTLMTLGISPTRPDTGYGYIKYLKQESGSIYKVQEFREKPDKLTAQSYVASGEYLWNAGMFVWSVKNILNAFEKYSPQIIRTLTKDASKFGTVEEQKYIDDVYADCENISIDYAILERADNVFTIPADIGWSDLGTWNSLYDYLHQGSDIVTIGKHIHLIESKDILVMSQNNKKIVIKGLKDYIVVDEENALLIYPKSSEQEIKEVVNRMVQGK